ncbi:hypothetical protein JOC78_001362 [Bacillus ectoiniformans]|uniref:hypothetical protein n=1 Tax=Bacillus ectoiniformans TaxID=1494429 RepID=UPI00195C8B46|nr:hypothetical protein [Bacillus ectoiniformans]MBM7648420.1 hypothetical protein [Bacillus ectoiniformans]
MDYGDQIVITFSEEIDPTTIHRDLTIGGMVNPTTLNELAINTDAYFQKMEFTGSKINDFQIGTFKVVGYVIIRSNDPDIDYISLDETGTILTIDNFRNVPNSSTTSSQYADASESEYIEFTPSATIKNKDGVPIDTNAKVREANGSKHF